MTTQTKPGFFGEFGESITFETAANCCPDAPEIAWWPESIDFRKSKTLEERFFLNLYLKWVFEKMPFRFGTPLQITRADEQFQPDFEVHENGRRYGLDVTRATTWRMERATEALIKKGPGYSLHIDSDLNGEDRNFDPEAGVSKDGSPLYDEPLHGVDLEVEWARLMAYRILEKQKTLTMNYSRFFPASDLVLYSAWPVPVLESAIKLLPGQYASLQSDSLPTMSFQRIAVVCENWAIFDPLSKGPQIFTSDGFDFL